MSSFAPALVDPLHIFLTGNAGYGKIIFNENTVPVSLQNFFVQKLRFRKDNVLVLAQASVATINIKATTIHSSLNIPAGCFGKHLPLLSDKMISMLMNKLSEVKVIVIDETSMVSDDLLLHINLRVVKHFAYTSNSLLQELHSLLLVIFYSCRQLGPDQYMHNIAILSKI